METRWAARAVIASSTGNSLIGVRYALSGAAADEVAVRARVVQGPRRVAPAPDTGRRLVLGISPARDLLPRDAWQWDELDPRIREGIASRIRTALLAA
jgi:hypothetical protein